MRRLAFKMRKPGRLLFNSHTMRGDTAVLRRYLESSCTTYCHVPSPQQHFIQRQIQELLQKNIGKDILKSEELWAHFFHVLLGNPFAETIRVKRCIAEMFHVEYHIRWEDCFSRRAYSYAMAMGPLADPCEVEIQRLAAQELVEETKTRTKAGLTLAAEKKYDAQLVPMLRRVEKFRKANGSWNKWKYKFHDMRGKEVEESPFSDEPMESLLPYADCKEDFQRSRQKLHKLMRMEQRLGRSH